MSRPQQFDLAEAKTKLKAFEDLGGAKINRDAEIDAATTKQELEDIASEHLMHVEAYTQEIMHHAERTLNAIFPFNED